jgi:hypothetical protein
MNEVMCSSRHDARKRLAFVFTGKRQLTTNLQELTVHQLAMEALCGHEVSSLAHLTRASNVAHSTAAYRGSGFLVEHHRIPEGERDEIIAHQHVLWLWTRSF